MPRLVVNPGTPQAWEIQLKPGLNFLGRGSGNDFKIEDLSVSTAHCQIVIENGGALIRDMGSTNGTFVNRVKVMEYPLRSGHPLRLGSVDMIYYTDGPDPVKAVIVPPPVPTAPPPPPPTPVTTLRISEAARPVAPVAAPPPAPPMPVAGLKLSGPAVPPRPTSVAVATPPPIPPVMPPAEPVGTVVGTRYCKFHPKTPARYLCPKCNRTFCDLCVNSRNSGDKILNLCRTCVAECVPFQFQAAPAKSFYAGLGGAFGYPFKGAGIIILVCATVAFAAMSFVMKIFGIFGYFMAGTLYGFTFLFMQNIIHTTTSDEEEPIGFPAASSLAGAAFQLGMTILASFWLAIALEIARLCEIDLPPQAIMAAVIVGIVYFPMAFLAVAMKDSVMAANPLLVVPSMMKVPAQYGITVLLLLVVFAVSRLGDLVSSYAGHDMTHTKDMSVFLLGAVTKCILGLISVYLLAVTMRILGLFYNASKDKLGWFTH